MNCALIHLRLFPDLNFLIRCPSAQLSIIDIGIDVKMTDLKSKIISREARLGIVGLGHVGLPLALEFVRAGFKVAGIEVDCDKAEKINNGISYILDVSSEDLKLAVDSGGLEAHSSYDVVSDLDCVSICVPTPLRKTKDPDISYIMAASEGICQFIHQGMLIVLESTTYPGTTEEVLVKTFERDHLQIGKDVYVAFSPERVDPGNSKYKTINTPKVVGGVTTKCTALAKLLYEQAIEEVVPVSSAATAEMVKLLENTFRAVNIGLVNEIAIMCDKLGVPVWEVIEAAATKPFGFMPFYPGPGLGGHCIPIDPLYLSWKLKMLNYNARFIELASEINTQMPEYCVQKIRRALNQVRKCVNGSRILVLGVAYKRDTLDVRESPALDIIRLLESDGAQIDYTDPFVPSLELGGRQRTSVEINPEKLCQYDVAILVTDHSCFDYDLIQRHSPLLFDTRHAFKEAAHNVVKL